MGKGRHNAKARQVVNTSIDNSKVSEIKLEFANTEYGSSDTSNLLALPSKKRETKILKEKKEHTRILSKQQRKRLEKIVEKKKKKENRAALIESLALVQATPDEVSRLTGISAMQTMGLRKLNQFDALSSPVQETVEASEGQKKFSSIAGAKKRLRLLRMDSDDKKKKAKFDPNVVGLEESSSDEDGSSESDEENDDEPEIIENNQSNEDIVTEKPNLEQETETLKDSSVKIDANEGRDTLKSNKDIIKDNIDKKASKDSIDKVATEKTTEKTPEVKEAKKPVLDHPTIHMEVKRDPKVQVARLKLPILGEEQRIMELVNENEILIIAGETGSGKTTQLPQFLYEAGYAARAQLAVTQPRRVAAAAMAARVAAELGIPAAVGYLVRYEGNVTKDTKIKFMTDGVLMKEIQSDFLLSRYSVIILDEAHERSVYTDILLGLLSRIVPLRRKRGNVLRLIIMSATLRVEDFTENTRLFKQPPPVINIEARQFPVTIHFNKHTYSDYLKEAYKKAVKIHTRLPEGGILIFVTGQQEVHYLVRKLKAAFPYRADVDYSLMINSKNKVPDVDPALDSEPEDIQSDDDEVEKEMKRARKARRKARQKKKSLPKINLDDYETPADDGQADLVDGADSDGHLSDSDDDPDLLSPEIRSCRQPLWVLPLYSMLASSEQARVFRPPPPGARLCVISTDVAETSLTIPGVKYVVDCGKKKMKLYDQLTGASAWRVVWTSQASAGQRAGRAGRVAPGHVYRLYSSAVHQHECPAHHPPDLTRRPVDGLLLDMKCMGIDKVVNFPFPTAPDRLQLRLAEKRLEVLGILEKHELGTHKKQDEEVLKVTPLGKAVSAFPLSPRYGKMMALSHQHGLLPYSITMVAALTQPEMLSGGPGLWPAAGQLLLLGDAGVALRAAGGAAHAWAEGNGELFCAKHGLREKAIIEIRKLRKQLTSEISLSVADAIVETGTMAPPDERQARLLRQLLLSALGDQVARKIGLHEVKEGEDKRKYKYAYHCACLDEPVHMHADSILRGTIPEWVVYHELYETGAEERRKMVMRTITAIEPEWLPVFVPKLCNLGDPLPDPEPRWEDSTGRVRCHFKGTFGKAGWELPVVEIDFPDKVDRYKWFARFLLEGVVFPKLRRLAASLLSPPATMVRPWAGLHARTRALLAALLAARAGNRGELARVWDHQPAFLLDEYLKWLPESAHNEVTLFWPPV